MSGALFGSSASGGRPSSKNLVEFRAGKMELKGTTVTPDKRKGLVYLHQPDDTLMHFCWKDRTTGTVVDDLIIFPDDCEFKRVPQCTTGRVYILKFKSSARKFFFWMQEPKSDKDDELCKKTHCAVFEESEWIHCSPETIHRSRTGDPRPPFLPRHIPEPECRRRALHFLVPLLPSSSHRPLLLPE